MQSNRIPRNMCCGCIWLLFFALQLFPNFAKPQAFQLNGSKKRTTMSFKMIRNMVIVELRINNRGPFNFILDTGVGIMLITDPKLVDSINLASKRIIKIYGLNGENYEAYVTPILNVQMNNITSRGVSAAILKKDHFGLSNYAGMHIHGLLGYDFFAELAVRFNFTDTTLTVYRPQNLPALRKGTKIPITIEEQKPYLTADIKQADGKVKPGKMLIDLGAGNPMSLENVLKDGNLPQNFISANLGIGLTGPIGGYISRVNEIELGSYKQKNVLASFPDLESLKQEGLMAPRDGSVGLGLLKRFTMIMDYAGGAMYLKRTSEYNRPYEHDMSGMEYYYMGDDYERLIVGRVEPGSPAAAIGLKKDDEITAINIKVIGKYNIEQIDNLFRSGDGRNLLIEFYRGNQYFRRVLTLKRRI